MPFDQAQAARVAARYMPLEFTLTVANYSPAERKNLRVTVKVNGEERPDSSTTILSVPPGETQKTFTATFQQLGWSQVTASLLQLGILGYREPNDPRMTGTYDLVMRRLEKNGLLYRYESGYDGMPTPEGAFGICSFWPIEYLAKRGDVEQASAMLDHICSMANDLGLFAEEIDPHSGAALGNFPQAFTHVGLINAALAIDAARRRS